MPFNTGMLFTKNNVLFYRRFDDAGEYAHAAALYLPLADDQFFLDDRDDGVT